MENKNLDQIKELLQIKTANKELPKLNIDKPQGYELQDGIRSKERVVDLAEVFTPSWLVNEMIENVGDQQILIDTRILEPSCGNGNFLIEILARKLQYIKLSNTAEDVNFQILKCLTSTYGIDISTTNIIEAHARIIDLISEFYIQHLGYKIELEFQSVITYVLTKNVLCADFLKNIDDIEICEYTFPKKYFVSRRIFTLLELAELNSGELVFPRPAKILSTVHYLELK